MQNYDIFAQFSKTVAALKHLLSAYKHLSGLFVICVPLVIVFTIILVAFTRRLLKDLIAFAATRTKIILAAIFKRIIEKVLTCLGHCFPGLPNYFEASIEEQDHLLDFNDPLDDAIEAIEAIEEAQEIVEAYLHPFGEGPDIDLIRSSS